MRPILVAPLLLALAAVFVPPAGAADDLPARVDALVESEMARGRIPGLALAVIERGEILLAKGYGLADVEHGVAVKPETIFQSGSVGKQFTAALVMTLVEEGRLGLDDSITRHLPGSPDAWKPVTIRHLLTHTGGMTDYPADFDFRRDYTEDELLARAAAIPLAFEPGTDWRYSNLGYVTLGILVGKVTGRFYGDLLEERIFGPLGMTAARVIDEDDIIPDRADGYVLAEGDLKHDAWVSPSLNTTADGSLYFSVLDMAAWERGLARGALLRPSSYEAMWTPVALSGGKTHPYGFGWALGEIRGHRIIEHGGAWQGFMAHIARYPDDGLAVIVLANLAMAHTERIAHQVAGLRHPELEPPPLVAIEDREPEVTAGLRALLTAFMEGAADPERFDAAARAEIFPDAAAQVGAALRSLGALGTVELLDREETEGVRRYRYRVTVGTTPILCSFGLNAAGLYTDLGLRPE